jgi:hypothetical protein
MNADNESFAPYGDGSLSPEGHRLPKPWRGVPLALVFLAVLLFAGAAVASSLAVVRIMISVDRESGADIGAGIIGVMALILSLAGCVAAALANRIRHS